MSNEQNNKRIAKNTMMLRVEDVTRSQLADELIHAGIESKARCRIPYHPRFKMKMKCSKVLDILKRVRKLFFVDE